MFMNRAILWDNIQDNITTSSIGPVRYSNIFKYVIFKYFVVSDV